MSWMKLFLKINKQGGRTSIRDLKVQTKIRIESGFQQAGGLVTRNISVFFKRVVLYFKAMSDLIDFYKGIFSHVIPVRVIVSWCYV